MPRLLTIIGGAVLAVVGGLFGTQYRYVEMPRLQLQISDLEREKTQKEKVRQRVADLQREMTEIQEKVNSILSLEDSRVRWARVLDRIRLAVPDDCVLRRFNYRPEAAAAPGVPTGKRFTISLQGAAAGETLQECNTKVLEFKKRLKQQLGVVEAGTTPEAGPTPVTGPAAPAPPGAAPAVPTGDQLPPGYSKFLGLRFEEPIIESMNPMTAGLPKPTDPKLATKLVAPSKALEFSMTVSFSMKPPRQAGQQ
jgi:Tfp pilus assembly protein PilN